MNLKIATIPLICFYACITIIIGSCRTSEIANTQSSSLKFNSAAPVLPAAPLQLAAVVRINANALGKADCLGFLFQGREKTAQPLPQSHELQNNLHTSYTLVGPAHCLSKTSPKDSIRNLRNLEGLSIEVSTFCSNPNFYLYPASPSSLDLFFAKVTIHSDTDLFNKRTLGIAVLPDQPPPFRVNYIGQQQRSEGSEYAITIATKIISSFPATGSSHQNEVFIMKSRNQIEGNDIIPITGGDSGGPVFTIEDQAMQNAIGINLSYAACDKDANYILNLSSLPSQALLLAYLSALKNNQSTCKSHEESLRTYLPAALPCKNGQTSFNLPGQNMTGQILIDHKLSDLDKPHANFFRRINNFLYSILENDSGKRFLATVGHTGNFETITAACNSLKISCAAPQLEQIGNDGISYALINGSLPPALDPIPIHNGNPPFFPDQWNKTNTYILSNSDANGDVFGNGRETSKALLAPDIPLDTAALNDYDLFFHNFNVVSGDSGGLIIFGPGDIYDTKENKALCLNMGNISGQNVCASLAFLNEL